MDNDSTDKEFDEGNILVDKRWRRRIRQRAGAQPCVQNLLQKSQQFCTYPSTPF